MIRCFLLAFLLAGCAGTDPGMRCTAWRPVMAEGRVVGEACKAWQVRPVVRRASWLAGAV